MSALPIHTPVGPSSIRVFAGNKLPSLTRENFFRELGDTFMPGTPCMLAPLGLAAYLPATIDPEPDSALPDEVALIVYASRDAYDAARQKSLEGRMYTHSHAGVFDLTRSRGQWPGTVEAPDKQAGTDRWCWAASDRAVDWQQGSTRVLLIRASAGETDMQAAVHARVQAALPALDRAGVDQAIFLAAPGYAVIWLHGPTPESTRPADGDLLLEGADVVRDLESRPVPMPTRSEGVQITGAEAFCFRFVRELRFFL